ncbi:MAG: hypothetical protein MJ214_01115 [Bacilli bacterium]|nr:hypothetical protein [Bacilli bacterium]
MNVQEALKNKNIIYKSLSKLDKDCRSRFNDTSVSNEDYFQYGIKLDLVTNMMAIFLNDHICGIGSPGIELNARNVLEAIAILKCHECGDLKKHNYDLYRELYLPIEYSNESVVFKWVMENFPPNDILVNRQKDLEGFYQKWSKFFGCKTKFLKSASRDSLFFLQKEIHNYDINSEKYPFHSVSPLKMINHYLGSSFGDCYQFLSILLHPAAFEENILEPISKHRHDVITMIYLYGLEYLNERGYLADNEMNSFDENQQNKLIDQNVRGALMEAKVLGRLNYATTHYLDNSVDYFYYRQIGSLIALIRDIEICRGFGFHEQAVIKFKIFIENLGVFMKVSGVQTQKEYAFMKRAYRLSTTYQLFDFYSRHSHANSSLFSKVDEPLSKLYNEYYKEKFPNLKLEDFIKGVKQDSLYFIYPSEEMHGYYRQVVKDYISVALNNSAFGVSIYNLYQISLDIGHSSGYAFNASTRVWDNAPKEIGYYMFLFLQIHFHGGKEYFKNKPGQVNFPDDALHMYDMFVSEKKAMWDAMVVNLKNEKISQFD